MPSHVHPALAICVSVRLGIKVLIAIGTSFGLVGLVTWCHFVILHTAVGHISALDVSAALRLLGTMYAAIFAHLVAASFYALAFWLGADILEIGSFANVQPMQAMDYFYFSLVTMTTLGLGDVFPTGHLRFVAGIEALNGFLLISCSASFVFMQMKANGDAAK